MKEIEKNNDFYKALSLVSQRISELEAENKKLREENAKLWAIDVHWELSHCPGCESVNALQLAQDDNAKLREACAELLEMAESHDPEWLHWPEMYEELRKLGVEV